MLFLAPIACPAGWFFYGSSCYKFSSLRKKWIDAKKDCRASGGYLLKIDDADEQHFITYKQSAGHRVSLSFSFFKYVFLFLSFLYPKPKNYPSKSGVWLKYICTTSTICSQ